MDNPSQTAPSQTAPWQTALTRAHARTRAFVWFLLKTILPLYLATELLKQSGLLTYLAGFLAPIMGLWKLPGEAAAVVTAGMFINLYAACAVAAPLGLTWSQVSVLGLMLGIAHSLPVEGVVVRQLTPTHYRALTLLRVGLGALASMAMAWVLP